MQAIESLGWELIGNDPVTGRIEAFERTTLFGFIDDVVIRVAATPEGTRIDVRSKSRIGGGDVGANAARIQRFVAEYNGQ